MNLKRCERGHFYDTDKFASCPHCQGGSASESEQMSATVRFSGVDEQQGVTLPVTVPFESKDKKTEYEEIPDSSGPTIPTVPNHLNEPLNKAFARSIGNVNGGVEDTGVTQRFSPGNVKGEPVVGWLVCISGENAGESYTLKTGRNFIGRSASMDVVLTGDMSISREKHAIILYEPRKREFLAQPGESRELFYVNDEVVLSTSKLNIYDKLLIGNTELFFIPFCGDKFSWEDLEKKDE